jgi:hypothetical protein
MSASDPLRTLTELQRVDRFSDANVPQPPLGVEKPKAFYVGVEWGEVVRDYRWHDRAATTATV